MAFVLASSRFAVTPRVRSHSARPATRPFRRSLIVRAEDKPITQQIDEFGQVGEQLGKNDLVGRSPGQPAPSIFIGQSAHICIVRRRLLALRLTLIRCVSAESRRGDQKELGSR